jgi:DHA3 family macrolide efflux protein-like MFS transporter
VSLLAMAVGGAIWAPYMPTSMALLQRSTTPTNRAQVLAANGAVTVVSVPAGTILGGPLVALFGARHTLLLCGLTITAFGVAAAALVARSRRPPADIDIDSYQSEGQPRE